MAVTTQAAGETLEVRRTFNAPRARVFEAWTKAEEIKKWAAPGDMNVVVAEVDLRVGGKFRLHLRNPNGTEHRAFGEYRVVDPPKRLVYSWSWETMPGIIDTIVTVEFHERGRVTEVVLRHDGLTAEQQKGHEKGWVGNFDKFEALFPKA